MGDFELFESFKIKWMSVSVSLGKVVVDVPVSMEIDVNGVDIPFDKEVVLD